MISKSHFEFITSGTHILHIAFATSDKYMSYIYKTEMHIDNSYNCIAYLLKEKH